MWFVKIFVCVFALFKLLLQDSIFRWLADSRSRFIFEQNLFLLSLAWFLNYWLNQALLSSSSCLGCHHTLQNEKDNKLTWSREREAKCKQGNKICKLTWQLLYAQARAVGGGLFYWKHIWKKHQTNPPKKKKPKLLQEIGGIWQKRESKIYRKKTETNLYGFYKIDNGTLILRPEKTTLLFCTDLWLHW